MKKIKFFFTFSILIVMAFTSLRVFGQDPSYYCEIKNDEMVSSTVYEMDLFLYRTGDVPLELANFQTALIVNPSFVNGGTISSEIIDGSSELTALQVPSATQFSSNCIKIAPKLPLRTYDNVGLTTTTNGTVVPQAGLKICRLRLTNTANFGSANMNPTWNFTVTPYRTVVSAFTGSDASHKTNTVITSASSHNKNLNLKIFLEGLYNGETGLMTKTRNSDGESDWETFAGNTVDTLSVLFAQTVDPYNIISETHGVPVNMDGSCRVSVPGNVTQNCYIIVKHRNSIETWSKTGGEAFVDGMDYNFTNALSQAFADNLKPMGSSFAIWSGDVTQDGYVDGFDLAEVFNYNLDGAFGYMADDVTGDGYVDGYDLALVFNNNLSGVGMNTPVNPMKKMHDDNFKNTKTNNHK